MADEQTQVLVVGAGLAGLSAAMFLAQRGIDVIAVERRPSSSPHPRATGQNPRTMELLRGAGVADDVLAAGLDTPSEPANTFDTSAISPAPWGHAAQNRVEPILLKRAEEFGADVWFSTELVSFEQDAYGVTARLMDKWSERISTVRADYLIAADGYRGAVRGRLGVARDGLGTLANRIGVLFEANLADHVDEHTVSFDYHPNLGESLLDFTAERLTGLIRVALDDPELDVKLLAVQPSEIAAGVVNDFRVGRIFLTGDAAAVSPPATGLGGGDTAVADGFDLAWKLAAVLHGEAGPALLNSYPAERRPFAELVMNAALHDPRAGTPPELDLSVLPEPIDPVRLMFGYRHRSGAVILEDDDPALAEDPCHPTGRPGYRAP
ncbi:MAG TPA: FAD-dependent oxidoreductase, partial [Pseudonocardiaceae bacterium]